VNTPVGNNQFQNIQRHVAKFRENRLRGVEKSVSGNKDKKLDGSIVWNAHNTALGSKRLAICTCHLTQCRLRRGLPPYQVES